MLIRDALPKDAAALAYLIDLAGEGIPRYLWSQMCEPGADLLAFGAARAAREEGAFSYRNAKILEIDGETAGMLLGYPLPEPHDLRSLAEVPLEVRPLIELEAEAPGTWYINAIATYERFRGRGVASRLLAEAVSLAQERAINRLSLIVDSENRGAGLLYEKLGFEATARKPVVPYPGCRHGGDWVLMVKQLSPHGGRMLS